MATVSSSGHPANVQAYLDKHKISILFEDLTSLLVKDLPIHPIDFLITKLQDKKKKTVSDSARPTSSTTGVKKPLSGSSKTTTTSAKTSTRPVTTSAASKTTSKTTTASKPAAAKSTGITRPVSSKTEIKRPVGTAGVKPVAKSTGPASKSSVSASSKTTSSVSRLPKSPASKVGVAKTAGVSPKKGATAGSKIGGVSSKTKPTEPTKKPDPVKKEPDPVVQEPDPVKDEPDPVKDEPDPVKDEPDPVKEEPKKEIPSEDTPLESAKEDVPSSADKTTNTEKQEEEEKVLPDESNHDDEQLEPTEEEESEEEEESLNDSGTSLDVEELLRIKRSKKLVKQGGGGNKAHLKDLLPADNKVGVVSHVCEEEEESEDEGLDVVESHEVLEEEGVVLSAQAKRASMKLPANGPLVDLKVTICARCAKVIKADEEGSVVMSSLRLTALEEAASLGGGGDESASQVAGTTVSFPQWDGSTVTDSSQLSLKEKWALTGQATPSSVATTTTSDEWQGLAPKPHPQEPPTDEESELKLPEPVDYHKPEDDESTVQLENED